MVTSSEGPGLGERKATCREGTTSASCGSSSSSFLKRVLDSPDPQHERACLTASSSVDHHKRTISLTINCVKKSNKIVKHPTTHQPGIQGPYARQSHCGRLQRNRQLSTSNGASEWGWNCLVHDIVQFIQCGNLPVSVFDH
jgi:hypothetical protein